MPARRTSWLKLYYHVKNDAVLNSLPDDEFRVWFKLLVHAADRDEQRGAFRDDATLALEVAGGDGDLLHRALARLVDYGHLELEEEPGWYRFPHFTEEQRRKPSDEPSETRERQRRSRARRRAEIDGHAPSRVTPSDAGNVTPLAAAGRDNPAAVTNGHSPSRVTAENPSGGAAKPGEVSRPGHAIRIRGRYRKEDEEEEAARAREASRVTERDGRTPAEAALIATLVAIDGFPPDEGAGTTRLAREYLAAFPDIDALAVARDYAAAELNHPPAWPRFRGFLKKERERAAAAAERASAPKFVGTNGHRPSKEERLIAAAKTWRPPPEHQEGR